LVPEYFEFLALFWEIQLLTLQVEELLDFVAAVLLELVLHVRYCSAAEEEGYDWISKFLLNC